LFLVPLLLANNTPKKALSILQHFYDTFYEKCSPSIKIQMQYIYKFLLVACGTEEILNSMVPTSQLAKHIQDQ